MKYLPVITLGIGIWMMLNGLLHDIFVLSSDHGKKYDRELLRLLMDGHILLTCGAMQIIAYLGLRNNEAWAYYVAGVACISLLIYCGMIFPFLKSIGSIILNFALLMTLIIAYLKTY